MDQTKVKQIKGIIIFTAIMILGMIYFDTLISYAGVAIGVILPFIIGGVMAFITNIPMIGIENKLLKKWKGKSADQLKRPISLLAAITLIVSLVMTFVLIIVPSIYEPLMEVVSQIPQTFNNLFNNLLDKAQEMSAENPEMLEQLKGLENIKLDWELMFQNVFSFMKTGFSSVITSTVSITSSIVVFIVNWVISFIFSIYLLSQKEKLASQGKRILETYTSQKVYVRTVAILQLLNKNFTNFIAGQCVEAVILGLMFVVVMIPIHAEYAILIGVLMAFTALIPIVGAFIGCAVGAFLLAMESPSQAVVFLIVFIIVQQIEGNVIYPKVVGNSVGLPSIWVLVAVSVGGSLFGVVGMLVFIPLLATIYQLIREDVLVRNKKV